MKISLAQAIKEIESSIDDAWMYPEYGKDVRFQLDRIRHFLKCPERIRVNKASFISWSHSLRPECRGDYYINPLLEVWVNEEFYHNRTPRYNKGSLYQFIVLTR